MSRNRPAPGDPAMTFPSAALAAPSATGSGTGYYPPGGPLAYGQTLAPPAAARTWPTIVELLNAAKRRLVLATFLGLLVGMAAAAAIWLAMPNGKHVAQALLQIRTVNRAGPFKETPGEADYSTFRKREETLILGRSLLERVVADDRVRKIPDVRTADDPAKYLADYIKVTWPSDDLMRVAMRGDNPAGIRDIVNVLVELYLKDATSGRTRRAGQHPPQAPTPT